MVFKTADIENDEEQTYTLNSNTYSWMLGSLRAISGQNAQGKNEFDLSFVAPGKSLLVDTIL